MRPVLAGNRIVACSFCNTAFHYLPHCGGPCCEAIVCPTCADPASGWCHECADEAGRREDFIRLRMDADRRALMLCALIGGCL